MSKIGREEEGEQTGKGLGVSHLRTSIKWDDVVINSISVFQSFIDRGVIPTLRTIHYALVSKNIIPNTKSAYKGLSSTFVKARQEGRIEWSWLADEGRDIESADDYGLNEYTGEEWANAKMFSLIDDIRRQLSGALNFYLSKWTDQQYYIEVWIEKNALRATFQNYLDEFKVALVPSRGYSSWTFLKEAYDRIRTEAGDRIPLILYFGDFDPSGEDIERFLRDSMNGYFGLNIEVKRIGVTKEQIEEYNLPTTPEDAEEIEKLKRDSRFAKWEYGAYRVELDALLAYVPDKFEQIVKESVKEYFNEDIYDKVLNKANEETKILREKVKEELPQKIKDLLKKLGLEDEDDE